MVCQAVCCPGITQSNEHMCEWVWFLEAVSKVCNLMEVDLSGFHELSLLQIYLWAPEPIFRSHRGATSRRASPSFPLLFMQGTLVLQSRHHVPHRGRIQSLTSVCYWVWVGVPLKCVTTCLRCHRQADHWTPQFLLGQKRETKTSVLSAFSTAKLTVTCWHRIISALYYSFLWRKECWKAFRCNDRDTMKCDM